MVDGLDGCLDELELFGFLEEVGLEGGDGGLVLLEELLVFEGLDGEVFA